MRLVRLTALGARAVACRSRVSVSRRGRTAQALAFAVPPSVLGRADEIIE